MTPFCRGAAAALALSLWATAAVAAAGTETPGSDADRAYQRGIAAAEQRAYEIALDQFRAAQAARPHDPKVLYALGATHVKAGRTLLGVLWLSAALRAAPGAENAGALRDMIRGLLHDAASDIERVFAAAAGAITLLPEGEERSIRLMRLIEAQAAAGDLEGAEVTLKALQASGEVALLADGFPEYPERYWVGLAEHYTALGAFPRAEAAIERVDAQGKLLALLAQQRLLTGDRAGAVAALARAEAGVQRMVVVDQEADEEVLDALVQLARGYAMTGQDAEYRRVLAQAQQFAESRELAEWQRTSLAQTEVDGLERLRRGRIPPAEAVPQLWIALAQEWDQADDAPLDLPAGLQTAQAQDGPGDLADVLLSIGEEHGRSRRALRSLEVLYPESRLATGGEQPRPLTSPLPPAVQIPPITGGRPMPVPGTGKP